MLRPTAIDVKPLDDYRLDILFENKEEKIFDVKPYIQGSWYGQLADQNYFKRVFVNGYTVEWPDGQDLCPDEIYFNSIKNDEML